MKKLSLQLEELAVESFETGDAPDPRGTVHGHGDSSNCSYDSPMYTQCRLSCMYECGESADCTPACPGGGGGGGGSADPTCQTHCRLSCAYPC